MYYEEFTQGQRFKSRSRIITATDVENFTTQTWAVNPIFLDDKRAQERGLPARVVPGALTFSYMIGLLYQLGIFDHILALASVNNLSFKAPVMVGDEIEAEAWVVETKETRNPSRGIVKIGAACINKTKQTTCLECEMTFVMIRKQQQ